MAFFANPIKLLAVATGLQVLANAEFQWTKLHATNDLSWTPCYSGLECSLLAVLLDYSSPAAGKASISIARYPAKCKKSVYRGPILLNPGGPGGSGVDYVIAAGADIASFIGDEYALVGFDPRGVSYSTPSISFFKTAAERALWSPPSMNTVYSSLNESADAIAQQWARAQLLGELAESRNKGYLQHMATDNIARDMLRITEAFGFEKLQYWGISYGSVLGSTFTSMFRTRLAALWSMGVVHRELDAVADRR
ncbi:hypothetical protein FB451DRAFT_597797 [Mycena latifolia]|nr:hypothetical protein FB451DRAFT_597797 [Mycena latifolia]